MIQVRPFDTADRDKVVELVLAIQRDEFGMSITAEDQPDLMDVRGFYRLDGGNFWVARAGERIVGTVGLLDIGGSDGALRKMFVNAHWRGREHGVASCLLDTLLTWAVDHGMRNVYLGTTAWFHAAHRFYERQGFVEVDRSDLPKSFPIMTVDTRFYQRAVPALVGA